VEYDELPWSHCYTWREPPHQEHICRGCLDEIAHCYKQREPPHQEHICRGCLDEIGDQLNLSAEIKALRTQAQAHEDKLDSLRAQMEEMKTMLKSLQGYKEDPEAADIDFDGYSRPRVEQQLASVATRRCADKP